MIKYVYENPIKKKLDFTKKFEIPASTLATILNFKDKFNEKKMVACKQQKTKIMWIRGRRGMYFEMVKTVPGQKCVNQRPYP